MPILLLSFLALELDTSLDVILSELVAYARMRRDENNAQARYQDMTDRAMSLYYQIAGRTSFLLPEIAAIPHGRITCGHRRTT